MLLRDEQAKANREFAATGNETSAPLSWKAINQLISASGNPEVSYDEFAQRWDSQEPDDQILKQLVARFDGQGLVIKTKGSGSQPDMGEPNPGKSSVAAAADQATDRAFA